MKKIMLLAAVGMQLSLSGCSSMNSSFDCPNKAGVTCKSLDQINTMVDNGQIQGRTSTGGTWSTMQTTSNSGDFQTFPSTSAYKVGEPIRYGETVQRIWIAPFEDTDGNYHQDSTIYSVMNHGHWIGHPVKADTEF